MPSDLNPVQVLVSYLSRQHQDKSTQEIGEALNMNRNLVSKYLTILHMQGRVELRTYGTLKMYRLSKRIPFQSITDIIEGVCIGLDRLFIVKEVGNDPEPFFHLDASSIVGKRGSEIPHPCFEDETFIKHVLLLVEGKKTGSIRSEYRSDTSCHLVRAYQTVFHDGTPGIAITFTDCTEEKNLNDKLEYLEAQHALLTNNCQEMIIRLSPDKRILETNLSYTRYYDQDPGEIIGATYEPLLPSEDIIRFKKAFGSLNQKSPQQSLEHRVVMKDGSVRWQSWRITAFFFQKKITGYILAGTDVTRIKLMESQIHQYESGLENILKEKTDELREITRNLYKEIEDRKRLEREISQKEELFRNLTESTSDLIWEIDDHAVFTYINPVFCKTLGITSNDILGKSLFDFIDPEFSSHIHGIFLACIKNNESFSQVSIPFKKNDGNTVIIELSGVLSTNNLGKRTGFRGIGRDITERKKIETEREKFLRIVERSPNFIGICDAKGGIQYLNPAGIRMLEIDGDEDIRRYHIDDFIDSRSKLKIKNALKTAMKEELWRGETVLISSSGKAIPVSQSIFSYRSSPRDPALYFSIALDISERIYHDQELARLNTYNRSLIQASLDPLVTIGYDGTIQDVNSATEKAIGLSREDLIGTDFNQYFSEPDRVEEGYQKAFSDGFIRDWRLEMKHQDGHTIPVIYNASVYRDESGKIQGVFAAARDMSNLYRVEDELREALDYYLKILDDFPNLVRRAGIDKKFDYFNRSLLEFTGRTREEEIERSWTEGIHPDDCISFLSRYNRSFAAREPFSMEYRLMHHDGTYHWIFEHGTPIYTKSGEFTGYIVSGYDIDQTKKAEEVIRISEKKYRQLHESLMDGYVSVDMNGNILEWNESYREMLGYDSEELRALRYHDITPEKWHESEQYIVQTQVLERGYSDVYEKEYQRKDGTVLPIELRTMLSRDTRGDPVSMWAIIRDVTERKKAEKTLIENKNNLLSKQIQLIAQTDELTRNNEEISRLEARYHSLFEYGPAGYIILDEAGMVCEINPEALRLLGSPAASAIGEMLERFIAGCDLTKFRDFFRMMKKSGKTQGIEVILSRAGITPFHVYIQGNILHKAFGGDDLIQLALMDISEKKVFEEMLKKNEAKYRLISDNSTDVIWLVDLASMRYVYISPSVQKLRGYPPEDVMLYPFEESLTSEFAELFQRELPGRIAAYVAGENSTKVAVHEIDQPCRNGSIVHTEVVTTLLTDADGKVNRILGVSRDISKRKAAEQKIVEIQESYRILFESSRYGVIFLDDNGMIISANPAAGRILGVPNEEMTGVTSGDPRWKVIHENGSPFPEADHPSTVALRSGKIIQNVLMGVFNAVLAQYIWIKITAIPLFRDGEKKPCQVYTIFEDITLEENLNKTVQNWQEQAVLLTNILEHSIQPFGITYPDGTLWYANSALASLLGYTSEDISSRTVPVLVASSGAVKVDPQKPEKCGDDRSRVRFQKDWIRRDGTRVMVEVNAHPISDESGENVYYYLLVNECSAAEKKNGQRNKP